MQRSKEARIIDSIYKEAAAYVTIRTFCLAAVSIFIVANLVAFDILYLSPVRLFLLGGAIPICSLFFSYGLALLNSLSRSKRSVEIDRY